jgi:hypothetical protein
MATQGAIMKSLLILVVTALFAGGIAGCEKDMHDVLTLPIQSEEQAPKMFTVPEKGTYYLYSSKDPKKALFQKDLKKGDTIGFSVRGDRARALAAGTIIELDDYSEGASYAWKMEDKKKE